MTPAKKTVASKSAPKPKTAVKTPKQPTTSAKSIPSPEELHAAIRARQAKAEQPSTAKQQKEDEKLGAKLRSKADIVKALQSGGTLLRTNAGLFRMANADGSHNRVSKRRAASFVAQGLVKLTKSDEAGKHYVFVSEAAEAAEKKVASKTKPTSEPEAAQENQKQ